MSSQYRHSNDERRQGPIKLRQACSVESGLGDVDFLPPQTNTPDHVTGCSSSASSPRSTPDLDLPLGHVFPSISDSLQWINERAALPDDVDAAVGADYRPVPLKLKQARHVQVLCTGSMHLVGALLSVLDPELNSHSAESL